jgi:predicted phage terminase large subunit-like protein
MSQRNNDIAVIRYVLSTEFYLFCQYYDPIFYSPDKKHLKMLCDALQEITDGEINNLMISVPPRAGKSYTVSLWSAWMIGRNAGDPDTSVMRNAYGQTLAEKFSYDVREIIKSLKFTSIFPSVRLKIDHSRIEDWAIDGSKQSTYFCAGVGGAITGKGCKTAAILDDPIKNIEDALSETVLEKTWLWYTSTHKSRMETGCAEIHIATRWSKSDPIGRLLSSSDAGKYKKIVIPALINGRSFCEAVKTTAEYNELKALTDSFIWEAEFMQNPIEAKGLLFPENELARFDLAKLRRSDIHTIIGYTDTADEGADHLVSITGALVGDLTYIVDVIFTQDPVEITEPLVANQIINNGHVKHLIESNNGGKGFARRVQDLTKGKTRCHIDWQTTVKNKETRILMSSGQIKQKFLFRNDYAQGSDYDKFMRQLTGYKKMGTGQHDDAPDGLTGLAEMIGRPQRIGFLSTTMGGQ